MYRSRGIVKKCAVPTGCFVEKIKLQFHKKSFILKLQGAYLQFYFLYTVFTV